jgi:hypothetical protein
VGKVEEVVPGSENDPFSKNYRSPTPVQPAPDAKPPVSQPDELKPSGAVDDIAAILARPEVSAAIGKQVEDRLAKAQSGLNKRDALLTKQLEDAKKEQEKQQTEMTRLQREVQVSTLSKEERATLQQQWDYEDKMKGADAAYAKVSDYHRHVEALRLVTEYGAYGFTPEMIEDDDSLEDMEVKALNVKVAFLEGGGKPAEKPAGPAAASAPSDLGGAGPAPKEFKLGTGQGIDAMSANLKALIGRPEQTL